jgi:hypothetical protein
MAIDILKFSAAKDQSVTGLGANQVATARFLA